jgi:hypothetical protein
MYYIYQYFQLFEGSIVSELSKNSKAFCAPGPRGTAPHCPMVAMPLPVTMEIYKGKRQIFTYLCLRKLSFKEEK